MATVLVVPDNAVCIRREPGSDITLVNTSNVDVYCDMEANWLNSSAPGTTPKGTRIAANGGQVQFRKYPCGGVWVRAVSNTTIEVQP